MIWFTTDKAGRWPELQNKLELHDLDYPGRKVPEDNTIDVIRTLHAKCLKDGAPPFPCPTEPLTYTELVKVLKGKGLISSFPPGSTDPALKPHKDQVYRVSYFIHYNHYH